MDAVMAMHIAAGLLALPAGAAAVAFRKGGRLHARAGTIFVLVLGFAPIAIMALWLVRLRFKNSLQRLRLRRPLATAKAAGPVALAK